MDLITEALQKFGKYLSKILVEDNVENIRCSPFSLFVTLGMISLLSNEETKIQILKAIGFKPDDIDDETLSSGIYALRMKLETTNMDSISSEFQNLYELSNQENYPYDQLPEPAVSMVNDLDSFIESGLTPKNPDDVFSSLEFYCAHADRIQRILRPTAKTSKSSVKLFSTENIWPNSKLRLSPSLFDFIRKQLKTDIISVEFPSPGFEYINDYIKRATLSKISEVITPQFVSSQTSFLCTSALSFSGLWKAHFISKETTTMTFTDFNQKISPVLMMKVNARFNFLETVYYKAVELPYVDPSISLVVVLPTENTRASFRTALIKFIDSCPLFPKRATAPYNQQQKLSQTLPPNAQISFNFSNLTNLSKTINSMDSMNLASPLSTPAKTRKSATPKPSTKLGTDKPNSFDLGQFSATRNAPSEKRVRSEMIKMNKTYHSKPSGPSKLESRLGIEIKQKFKIKNVKIQLPQFEIDSPPYSMKPSLEKMGITDLFSSNSACFVGRSYVSDIVQKTRFDVGESGMKIKMRDQIDEDEEILHFYANRPFWYFVMDTNNWNIIIIGSFTM